MKGKVLPFVEREARAEIRRKPGYIVRLFDPRGRYPKVRIAHKDALYWAAEDLTFMATWSEPWDWYKRDMPYTEMDWAEVAPLFETVFAAGISGAPRV